MLVFIQHTTGSGTTSTNALAELLGCFGLPNASRTNLPECYVNFALLWCRQRRRTQWHQASLHPNALVLNAWRGRWHFRISSLILKLTKIADAGSAEYAKVKHTKVIGATWEIFLEATLPSIDMRKWKFQSTSCVERRWWIVRPLVRKSSSLQRSTKDEATNLPATSTWDGIVSAKLLPKLLFAHEDQANFNGVLWPYFTWAGSVDLSDGEATWLLHTTGFENTLTNSTKGSMQQARFMDWTCKSIKQVRKEPPFC